MDSLNREMAVVLRQYNVHPTRIRFVERGFFVTVGDDIGWLQPWRRRIDAQRYVSVYRRLTEQNSDLLLPLVRTKKRQPAVFTGRRAYTFSQWPNNAGRLKPPQSVQEFRLWGAAIGKLQRQLAIPGAGDDPNARIQQAVAADPFPFAGWVETMRNRRQKILEMRQKWQSVTALAEEEQLFLRNVPPMLERLETALWILEDLRQQDVPQFSAWTLGDLSESFIALPSGEWKLAPWKSWLPGNGLSDLGRLLLLSWETAEPSESMKAALDGFEQEWPLSAEAYQALLAYMMFPHTLWSLVQQALANHRRPSARLVGASHMPHLPVDVEQLRDIYRQEERHRPLLAWLNRKIAERRAPKRIVRRLTEP